MRFTNSNLQSVKAIKVRTWNAVVVVVCAIDDANRVIHDCCHAVAAVHRLCVLRVLVAKADR